MYIAGTSYPNKSNPPSSRHLDALFSVTHAPGQSAYNKAERRMAPLSLAMSGAILLHDAYGNHLDANGKIINAELELRNVKKAGEVLAEIWSALELKSTDGRRSFKVHAEYVEPVVAPELTLTSLDERWKKAHVRQSQYLLQIVKCGNAGKGCSSCVTPFRSNLPQVLTDRFIPTPFHIKQTEGGVEFTKYDDADGRFAKLSERCMLKGIMPSGRNNFSPYDAFCRSVHDELDGRICTKCIPAGYYPSKPQRNDDDESDTVVENDTGADSDIHVFSNADDLRAFCSNVIDPDDVIEEY